MGGWVGGGGLDGVIGVKKDRFKERAHDKLVLPITASPGACFHPPCKD